MAYDRERSQRAVNAVATTAPRQHPASPAERRVHIDERTHAKSLYQRDGQGREVYATYYNSNDDPTFQARHNAHGNTAFVTSSAFTFVSHGGVPQQQQRAPRAVVEDASDAPEVETRGSHRFSRTAPTAQPIVEEPDDDDECDDNYNESREEVRHARREPRYDVADPYLSPRHHSHRTAAARPYSSDAFQLSPFVRPRAMMMNDFMMDDFFGGPGSPFAMMDAMRQNMAQQRAAMFGGVDPFANFF